MTSASATLPVVLVLLLTGTGCGGRAATPDGGDSDALDADQGGQGDLTTPEDAPVFDLGADVDAVSPPDAPPTDLAADLRADLPVDRQIPEDGSSLPAAGQSCDPAAGETGCEGGTCASIGGAADRGLCTRFGCALESGDPCGRARCVSLVNQADLEESFCALNCDFDGGFGDCPSGLSCTPHGVCLSACLEDTDCLASERCDGATGTCLNRGGPLVVGEACDDDVDCPAAGFCMPDEVSPGGYCTVVGCARGGAFACPDASDICVDQPVDAGFTVSLCLAQCLDASDCRPGYVCTASGTGFNVCVPG